MEAEVIVHLGGRAYTVKRLPILASKAWRDKLAGPFGEIAQTLTAAGTVELSQFVDIADLVRSMSGILLGSVDTMLDLLFDYAPALADDRKWIEENAYDDEALHAFS